GGGVSASAIGWGAAGAGPHAITVLSTNNAPVVIVLLHQSNRWSNRALRAIEVVEGLRERVERARQPRRVNGGARLRVDVRVGESAGETVEQLVQLAAQRAEQRLLRIGRAA